MENIISRTEHSLELISNILENQIEHKRVFAAIHIYSSFNLFDYDSFQERILSLNVNHAHIINILRNIYEKSKKNIELNDTIYNSPEGTYGFGGTCRRRVTEPWIDYVVPPQRDQQYPLEPGDIAFDDFGELENTDFLIYCSKIEASLRPIFQTIDVQPTLNNIEETKVEKLIDFFNNPSHYSIIMSLLVEKGFCQEETLIWKDKKKGYKKLAAGIIMYLYDLGYYKINPTNDQIVAILKSAFNLEVSIDTVKHTDSSIPPHILQIPPATSIIDTQNTQNTPV